VAGVVNEEHAAVLKGLLETRNPDAGTTVTPQPEGVEITISGPLRSPGVSGPGTAMDVELRISLDGPVMRFLLDGHL
jgi:hypothetical protein